MHRAHIQDLMRSPSCSAQIYCPAQLSLHRRAAAIERLARHRRRKAWPIVRLRFGASVLVDTEFRDLMVDQEVHRRETGNVRQRR